MQQYLIYIAMECYHPIDLQYQDQADRDTMNSL